MWGVRERREVGRERGRSRVEYSTAQGDEEMGEEKGGSVCCIVWVWKAEEREGERGM